MTSRFTTKAQYAQNIGAYLAELEVLLGRKVDRSELMSLDDTERLASEGRKNPRAPKRTIDLRFEDLTAPAFKVLILDLSKRNPGGVFVWTPRTRACGLLPTVPITEVNFGFPFSVNSEGMLQLVSKDLEDDLVLDFEEVGDTKVVQGELSGKNWGVE